MQRPMGYFSGTLAFLSHRSDPGLVIFTPFFLYCITYHLFKSACTQQDASAKSFESQTKMIAVKKRENTFIQLFLL